MRNDSIVLLARTHLSSNRADRTVNRLDSVARLSRANNSTTRIGGDSCTSTRANDDSSSADRCIVAEKAPLSIDCMCACMCERAQTADFEEKCYFSLKPFFDPEAITGVLHSASVGCCTESHKNILSLLMLCADSDVQNVLSRHDPSNASCRW